MHQYIKSNIFKVVSFSSYFHLNYSLFGQVLYYTNSLTFQDFFLSKIALRTFYLTILMIIGRSLLLVCLSLSRWNQSVSLADTFYCISFWNISVTTLSLFSFSFPLTPWIRRQFLLEYFSWRSRLLSIVSTFLFKVFTSFFSSEISFFPLSIYFYFLKFLINERNRFINFLHVPSAFNLNFVEEESSKISVTFFSKFCKPLYKIPAQRDDCIPSL